MEQVREKAESSLEEPQQKLPKDPYIGRKVGNLQIVEKVGVGGFGSVYRAEHVGLKTSFAVKILHFQMQSAPRAAERFRREALAIASLSHQNIVRVSDFGAFDDGGSYLVMDFLSGQDLEDCFHHNQRFDLFEIRHIVEQICAALDYIHRKGVVHRDLKPANISLEQERAGDETVLKLFDFGIAALEEDASITHTGVCMGSPLYMSPEQATGETKHADGRTDIYSLGVITYELLVGFPPFQGSVKSVMYKQVHQKPMSLREVRPHISWSRMMEKVVQKGLAKEPENRFQDALAFRDAFAEACEAQLRKTPDGKLWSDGEGPQRHGAAEIEGLQDSFDIAALRRQRKLRPLKIMAAVSLLSLLIGASLWYFWLGRPQKPGPAPRALGQLQPMHPGKATPDASTTPAPDAAARKAITARAKAPDTRTPEPPPREAARPALVTLRITSSPRRAWIYRKGTRRKRTPLTITGRAGEAYRLTIRAKYYKKRTFKGTFSHSTKKPLHIRLRRVRGDKKGPFLIDDPI